MKRMKKLYMLLVVAVVIASINSTMVSWAKNSEMPFVDVKREQWFFYCVKYVYEKEIMTGLREDVFGPNNNISRAMVVTVLWRMAGEPEVQNVEKSFPDVSAGKWYSKAIDWAKEENIVGGYDTGLFGPNDFILRQDFVKLLRGYTGYLGVNIPAVISDSYKSKADAKDVSKYAEDNVE